MATVCAASELAHFLSCPESYAEPTSAVSIVETHISQVFLTDTTVYKLKKTVRFPFLDYSTLDRRRAACREEVRLNSRLAPGVYAGVVPIVRGVNGELHLGGEGTELDFCVKMRRLPAERMLDRLIERGHATPEHIARLLDVLIPFYAQAARGPEIQQHASASAIEGSVRENLSLFESAGQGLCRSMFQRVRASQLQFLKLSADRFDQRIRSGHVSEGHGDLRPEHVCMLDECAIVFDCVEFSLPLRSADVISELAFLAMELDFLGAPELARALLRGYRTRTGDDVPDSLVSFYKSYRACVRAKVELLRARQEIDSAAEHSRTRARRYLQLASFYTTEFYRPKLFVMVGAAGTGKSTVADALSDALGLEVLRTDAIRHELADRRDPDAQFGQGIYCDSMNSRTYETLFERAGALLRDAVSVVLDGTFRTPGERQRAIQLAHQHGAGVHFVYCRCPSEIARTRIASRVRRGDSLSDARPEMHDVQQEQLDTAQDLASLPMIIVNTMGSTSGVVARVIDGLRVAGT
jgi:aminoglycoside phosphotransferase family enzyme/predicted kinase